MWSYDKSSFIQSLFNRRITTVNAKTDNLEPDRKSKNLYNNVENFKCLLNAHLWTSTIHLSAPSRLINGLLMFLTLLHVWHKLGNYFICLIRFILGMQCHHELLNDINYTYFTIAS